jgi:hypothetical protein
MALDAQLVEHPLEQSPDRQVRVHRRSVAVAFCRPSTAAMRDYLTWRVSWRNHLFETYTPDSILNAYRKASHDGQAGTSRCQSMGSAFWVEPLGIFTVLSEWPSSSLERCLLSLALCTWPARF